MPTTLTYTLKGNQHHPLSDDLENYFSNTIVPQLFVDANLVLTKFTPPAMKQFSLVQEDIGKNVYDVTDNIRYPTLVNDITAVITSGEILEKEVQTTDKKWFQMNILPYIIREQGKTNGVIITFVDISNRIATLKELEKLNADHDTLMYTLSHDIKQPLSTLVLLADELTDAYTNGDTQLFTRWIETLTRASKNIRLLLHDFAEHIKNKTGESADVGIVDIESICSDVILALRDDIYNNGISITTSFNAADIMFSRKNARSIIYNLLSNAIKYKHATRPLKIIITTTRVKGYIQLSVKDNGKGIAGEYKQAIFKKFTRLNHQIEGTGMGLYIISRMLADNNGKIAVVSTLGKGSTFTVKFKSE